jgi:hypothetical protein
MYYIKSLFYKRLQARNICCCLQIIIKKKTSLRLYFSSHSEVVDTARRNPYFDAVVGLVWSHDPESYAGCSVTTGRASHARQFKGDDPGKKIYPGPPGWGGGVEREADVTHKNLFVEKLLNEEAKIHIEP